MTHKVVPKGGGEMPKVTLTEKQCLCDRWRKNLVLLQGGKNSTEMAKIIGAKTSKTFTSRVTNPEKLTLDEIHKLCKYFDVSETNFIGGELIIGVKGGDKN